MADPDLLDDEPQDAACDHLIGTSRAMRDLRRLLRLYAVSDAPVMLLGPSGSGKEAAARALHALGSARRGAFVPVNCGAIPADLIESELFGHERGSFTGAVAQRIGRFEQAAGGTLFLDEIGEMPPTMQVRLLRVLEDGRFERVGGTTRLRATGRIICATHRDLAGAVVSGQFREDLWYRLAVLPVHIPALAERSEDIPALIAHFRAANRAIPRFSDAALLRLMAHRWPGNVRELRNCLLRAAALADGQCISADRIDAIIAPQSPLPGQHTDDCVDLKQLMDALERRMIEAGLARADGNVAAAARLIGIKRTTLVEKLRRHGLSAGAVPASRVSIWDKPGKEAISQ